MGTDSIVFGVSLESENVRESAGIRESGGLMNREEIERQAEEFFEWPCGVREVVTYTSALLFAEHCVKVELRDGMQHGQVDRLGGK